jgi:hypothetical protein
LQAEESGITTAEIRVTFIGQPLVIQGLRIEARNTVAKAQVTGAGRRRAQRRRAASRR